MITFKKATLTTENESKDGILVILENKVFVSMPNVFVPYNETIFYTDKAEQLNQVLDKCKETMLEMMDVADLPMPFIDDLFFDEKSGLLINFTQPEQPESNWQTSPVFIKLIDPIEWLDGWNADKNIWIASMLNKNPPEELKNRLIAYVCK